jgi:hypothetical protein
MNCWRCGNVMGFWGSMTWELYRWVIRYYKCRICPQTNETVNAHEEQDLSN